MPEGVGSTMNCCGVAWELGVAYSAELTTLPLEPRESQRLAASSVTFHAAGLNSNLLLELTSTFCNPEHYSINM